MAVFKDLSGRGPSVWKLRVYGFVTVLLVVLLVVVYQALSSRPPSGREEFTVVSSGIGDGVAPGADVRMRGMTVGQVREVSIAQSGTARIVLAVDRGRFREIATPVQPRFVSANVFGKTAVELDQAETSALRPGQVVVLADAIGNYTVTSLMRDTGRTVLDVVTPRLTQSVKQTSRLVADVSPGLTAALEAARAWREGHRGAPIDLGEFVKQASDLTADTPATISSVFGGLYDIASIPIFGDPVRVKWYMSTFRELGGLIGDSGIGRILTTLQTMIPLLDSMGDILEPATYSLRNVNAGQIQELISRLDRALPMVDGRPVLNVSAAMSLMPGMAQAPQPRAPQPPAPQAPASGGNR